jgi:hypothetical protein
MKLHTLAAAACLVATLATAQDAAVLRDLDAHGRVTLTKDELNQLLPNAKMSRVKDTSPRHKASGTSRKTAATAC